VPDRNSPKNLGEVRRRLQGVATDPVEYTTEAVQVGGSSPWPGDGSWAAWMWEQ